jgi:Domain of unknown function (DUF4864)
MNVALRWFFAVILLHSSSVFAAGTSWPTAQDWADIRQVIQSQLDAFQRDDGEASYALAAPSVKQRFTTPEAFNKMVRDNYSPIYNPRELKFLTPSIAQGRILQGIQFLSDENQLLLAVFTMERQEDKSWKIKACNLMPVESKTAT